MEEKNMVLSSTEPSTDGAGNIILSTGLEVSQDFGLDFFGEV